MAVKSFKSINGLKKIVKKVFLKIGSLQLLYSYKTNFQEKTKNSRLRKRKNKWIQKIFCVGKKNQSSHNQEDKK